MKWSAQQSAALDQVSDWLDRGTAPFFYLAGYAGTGKTTLAKHFADGVGNVLFGAYTGKAASVMRSKGCTDATTIHRLIYRSRDKGTKKLKELQQELADAPEETKHGYRVLIRKELENLKAPAFVLNEESEARRASLIIIDECFVKGTMVDTPNGVRRIEDLRPGDSVISAAGADTVTHTSRKQEKIVAKIYAGEKTFYCSQGHPFFTREGIRCAGELRPGDELLSSAKAMRLLREDVFSSESLSAILQSELCHEMETPTAGYSEKALREEAFRGSRKSAQTMAVIRKPQSQSRDGSYIEALSIYSPRCSKEDQQKTKRDRPQTLSSGRKWERPYGTATHNGDSARTGMGNGACSCYTPSREWTSKSLQDRHSSPGAKNSDRNRWAIALSPESSGSRSEENSISDFIRVDSVEILKQECNELEQFRDEDGQLYLYDIAVERHPSFSVEGILVHNCSMVSGRIADDLMSFNVPILVLGDPAQLPPVHGKGFFTAGKPDIMLTEVHRQAKESGILALATEIREGGKLYLNKWHDCEVIRKDDLDSSDVPNYDQILVGTNKKRSACNIRMREMLGRTSDLPEPGDRLVCLKNNHELGLLNGEIWNTLSAMILDEDRIGLTIENEEDSMSIVAWRHPFEGRESEYYRKNDVQEFTFGYTLTVHKAQGSQWPRVLVFDESYVFRQNAAKHLYTAITRASEHLTVVM